MRFPTLFSAALLSWLSVVRAESDVISLVASNFSDVTENEPLLLLEFFAPWCGHCKALAPNYEEAATKLKDEGIKLAKVDCVDQADLCQSQGVQGYPTLKIVRKGQFSDYSGPRKTDGIVSYMIKQSLPAVVEVTSENLESVKEKDKLVIVAYATSTTDAPAPMFSELAEKHRDDYLFGMTTDSALIEAAGVKTPTFIVYRKYDEPRTDYPYPDPASASAKEIEDWLAELAIPVLDEVNADNYALYAGSNKPLSYVFIDTSVDNKVLLDAVRPIAAKYHSKMNFVWIDAIKFGEHAKALNVPEAKWPAFVIQDMIKQLKYPMSQAEDLTTDRISEWVAKYLDGGLQPELKSAPIPETQEGNVYEIVGKTFEEIVFDDSKDVFVEFYASWCGHCKRLKPIWDQLGDNYARIKDRLLIAKMEAADNDLPASVPFSIKGFPTLKFKPAGTREWIDYEGDRTLESFVEFIEANAKNSLEPPPVEESEEQAVFDTPEAESSTAEPEPSASEEPHDEL